MNNNNLKISVVTVCYNVVDTIEQTMLSVLGQTYPNIEYIVIDGGSTDGTVDIIRKYADRLAYWVSEPDKGIYDAMNKGIVAATGDYINFMNAGDRFYDNNTVYDTIAKLISDEDVVYGDTMHVTNWGEYVVKASPLSSLVRRMPIVHQSIFVKTSLMKERGFDTSFRICSDYHFFYNCYAGNRSFLYVPLIISKYDLTKGVSLNYRVKLREDARIWGVSDRLSWKIKYRCIVFYMDAKNVIKNLMPRNVLQLYKRYIIKKRNLKTSASSRTRE